MLSLVIKTFSFVDLSLNPFEVQIVRNYRFVRARLRHGSQKFLISSMGFSPSKPHPVRDSLVCAPA